MNTRRAAEETGVTYRRADHWAGKGYLGKKLGEVVGSGNEREWSRQDVEKLRLMGELVDGFGMSPVFAGRIVMQMSDPGIVVRYKSWRLYRIPIVEVTSEGGAR